MWTDFESCSPDDVTVTDMYCTSGVFRVGSTTEVTTYPDVKSSVQKGRIVVGVDGNVILLDNDEENTCELLKYDFHVDCLTTANAGQVVVCGLADGHVHGCLINGVPIFDLSINPEEIPSNPSRVFVDICETNGQYYLMTTTGSLYTLDDLNDNLNLQQNAPVADESQSGDSTMVYDQTLMSPVSLRQVFKAVFSKLQVLVFTVVKQKSIVYCDRHFVYQHPMKEKISPDEVIKVKLPRSFDTAKKIINLENFILLLTEEGRVYQFDSQTKTVVRISNALFEDVLVLENDLNETVELMVLSKSGDKKRSLKLMNFPEMKSSYELPMTSEHCWLVSQAKSSMNMYFIEGSVDDDEGGKGSLPKTIEFQQITELHPMQRFKKLVSRGLIDEAEEFAKQMNLSLDIIHEHRVHVFVMQIANERNTEELRRKFKKFLELLSSITNVQFLVNLRRIDIPDRGLKEKFLRFLLERLSQKEPGQKVENEWEVFGEIEEILLRLDTLKIIDSNSVEWQNFTDGLNLFKCCLWMLNSSVQNASLVWSRHSSSIIPFMKKEDLEKVFASIPKDTELIEIVHWLRHVTPGLLQVFPQFLSMAVNWCVHKASSLESSSLWPANSLQFMKNVSSIFSSRDVILVDSELMYQSNMETLRRMVEVLQELAALSSDFNLTMKLENYNEDDLDKTVVNLLQRVQINHLKKLLTDFIMPLFLRHNQSADGAMAQYIQFLVENRKFTSQWQEKSVIVIEMLTSEDERFQSALLVLTNAPVPWIDELKPLIEYGKSSHPLAAEILVNRQLQVLKMIRIRYDYSPNSRGNDMQLVYRIVKLCRDEMVSEIRSIVKLNTELRKRIFLHCIPNLVQHDQLEKAIELFDDFNSKSEETAALFSKFEVAFENATELYMQKAIKFLKNIASRSTTEESKETIDRLQRIYKLRSGYGVKLACANDLWMRRNEILYEGIEYILEELRNKMNTEDVLEETFNDLVNLCSLLRFDCAEGLVRMCHSVGNTSFTFAMTSLLVGWDVCPVSRQNYEEYLQLGVLILAQVIDSVSANAFQDLPLYQLAYEIFSSCASFAQLDVIELHNLLALVRIGKNLYHCVDSFRWFEANAKTLTEEIGKFFSVAQNKDSSKRSSTRKSRRESYSVFNETLCVRDIPSAAPNMNRQDTNVDLVTNCLCIMMEMMVLKEEESIMAKRFRKFFAEDFHDSNFDLLSKEFVQVVNKLYQHEMLEEMHSIFHEMLRLQKRLGVNVITDQYALGVTKKLLCVMLSKEDVDIQVCYSILTEMYPMELLAALEPSMKSTLEKRNYFALSEYFHLSKNRLEEAAKFKMLRVKYKYFAEIAKENPSVKLNLDNFNANALPYLKVEIPTLRKLCHEFGCSYQDVIMGQILQILKTKELKFLVSEDEMGVEKISVLTSVQSILEQCEPLVNEIVPERVPLFVKCLIKFAEEVDSYFYEMFLVIIEILSIRDALPPQMASWKYILLILKEKMVTRRRVRPNQAEMEWWSATRSEARVLPKIAKYRFPFIRLKQSLADTLGEEINVENCVSWFSLLRVYVDSQEEIDNQIEFFCSRAVKNSINEWKMQNDDNRNTDEWHLMPENNDFLQAILRLVYHVKSEYKAFSILFYTMNQMPEGADQVEAAYECYNFAIEHEASLLDNPKAKDAVAKILRKYPLLKTQHLLHVYNMTDDFLMDLIEKPKYLIVSLYMHQVILKEVRPDVKKLAAAIAEVHNLPLYAIESVLLGKLLKLTEKKEFHEEVDESCIILENDALELDHFLKNLDQLTNYEITRRVNYILSDWPDSSIISFFVLHMHELQDQTQTTSGNSGVLQKYILLHECLAMIQISDDSKAVIDVFKQDEFMTCKIIYLLSRINFQFDKCPVTAQTFMVENTVDILKELWKNYAKTREMIEAMLLICLRYRVNVKEIWDSIIKKMIALHMNKELRSLIDLLATRKELSILPSLPLAIQYILQEPLKAATKEKTQEQEVKLVESLLMLQTCRLTSKLDLLSIGEKFVSLERPYMAAVVLPFMCKIADRKTLIQLLEPFKNEKLKRDIDELCEYGVMSMITRLSTQILFYRPDSDEEEDEEEEE